MRGAVLLAWVLVGCGPSAPPPSPAPAAPLPDAALLGLRVDDAVRVLALALDASPVIHEPPGVGRGVIGRTPRGAEIWLYVDRREAGFTERPVESLLPRIRTLPVIGVARREAGTWSATGEVIPYYHAR
jgi:hypothetical protein